MKKIIFLVVAVIFIIGILSTPADSFLDYCRKVNVRAEKRLYIGLIYRLNGPDIQYYDIFYNSYSNRYDVKVLTTDWEFLAYEEVKLKYFRRIQTDLNFL